MSVDTAGTLFIIWLVTTALFGGLVINMRAQGYFGKFRTAINKINPVFFLPPFLIIFMVIFYFYVTPPEDAPIASLGTLGDFIGGMLNPLLAFGTVVLLLKSLTHESNVAEKARVDIEESNLRKKLELISETRNNARADLHKKLTSPTVFGKPEGLKVVSIEDYFLKNPEPILNLVRFRKLAETRDILMIHLLNDTRPDTVAISWQVRFHIEYVIEITALLQEISHITKCHKLLIENEPSGVLRNQRILEYDDFLHYLKIYKLISDYHIKFEVAYTSEQRLKFDKTKM